MISASGSVHSRLDCGEIHRGGFGLDGFGERCGLAGGILLAPVVDGGLQRGEALVEAGLGDGGGEVAHQRRGGAALGEHPLGGVVGGVEVDVGEVPDQPVRPALCREADVLAGHEFQRAVGAEVEHRVEILVEVPVERREGVGRREVALEQEAHRVALVAEGRLHADEDVAEVGAVDVDRLAVGLLAAGRCAPFGLDLGKVRLARDMVVDADPVRDVGAGAERLAVAGEDRLAQRVDVGRQVDGVALGLQRVERVEEAFVDGEEGGRARGARVGREVEDDGGELAGGALALAQRDHPRDAAGESAGTLGVDDHLVAVRAAAAEHLRVGGTVQLRDRHHHGGLDREVALRVGGPVLHGLEFQRLADHVGDVELGEKFGGAVGVVVCGAADQREAGEGHDGVHRRLAVLVAEIGVDGGAVVEAGGEGRHHGEALRLQRRDDAVIVRAVARKHVGAHQEEADGAACCQFAGTGGDGVGGGCAAAAGGLAAGEAATVFGEAALAAGRGLGSCRRARCGAHGRDAGGDAADDARVVEADVRVFHRRPRAQRLAKGLARAAGVAADEVDHQVGDVVFGACQPVLHAEEVGAHVLCGAGDEAQHPRQAAQHLQLLGAGRLVGSLVRAAQLFQHPDRRGLGPAHLELAEARLADHLAGAQERDDRVAIGAARLDGRQDRADVLVEEEHRRDDDVGLRDIALGSVQQLGIVVPHAGGMESHFEAGQRLPQPLLRPRDRARKMVVERHDRDAHGCGVSGRSEL